MSTYPVIDVRIDNGDGTPVPVPGAVIKVYDVTNDEALDDLVADGDGHVPAGTLAVAAGTLIRFSVQRADGLCGYAETITT